MYVLAHLARQLANEPNEPARLETCVSGPAFCSLASLFGDVCKWPCIL